MADHLETKQSEPMAVEVADQTEPLSSPPSHNSDAGKIADSPPSPPVEEAEGSKMVDSEQPVHRVLGGGKPADVLLWKNKKISAGILGGATAIWAFFEVLEYHLLPLICYALILVVALLFLWSNAHIFIYKTPPHLPEVRIKDEPFLQVASAARTMINRAIATLGDIASGRDVKKFLAVVAGLWILSVIGSWCNFLTLFYIAVVLLHTVPVVYEKYKGKIDTSAQRIMVESKKRYAVFNEKVVSKLPKGVFREKKE
ncbi:reticulon-like protein B1 [Cucurbita pepo subsp. pepo]|uniref:reticulon-like protein B1 n=1 Tax=Cucurbita pepo subsp. pepo TaxID=3664 RepID=UPI000C9D8DE9|nr:reticulon-like protein B1 [Cucurbita pepo subsp. pepo]